MILKIILKYLAMEFARANNKFLFSLLNNTCAACFANFSNHEY